MKYMESVLCRPTSPEHGACPGMRLVDPVTFHWDVPFPADVSCKWLLGQGGTLCTLSLLNAGILSELNLCRSCSGCHSLCTFRCISALFCLEDTVFLESVTSSDSYNHFPLPQRSLSLDERGLSAPKAFMPIYCPVLNLYINMRVI